MGKGGGDVDTSGLTAAAWQAINMGQEQLKYGKKQYETYTQPIFDLYKSITGGGEPAYAAAQKSGLFDPYVRQMGSWERGQRERALDVAGLGPASKYMATQGISQQAEGMKSQGIMGQLQNMMNQLTAGGMGMYGTAGGLGTSLYVTGMGGLTSATQMQTQLQLEAQRQQAGMWGNIVGSIASIGGLGLGMGLGGGGGGGGMTPWSISGANYLGGPFNLGIG